MLKRFLLVAGLIVLAGCGPEPWPTYVNARYEFAMPIPPGWSVNEELQHLGIVTFYSPELKARMDTAPDPEGRVFDLSVAVYTALEDLERNAEKKLSFEDWVRTPDVSGARNPAPATIGGIAGYRWTQEDGSAMAMVAANGRVYALATDGPPTETTEEIVRRFVIVNAR